MLSRIIISQDKKVYEVVSEHTNELTTEQIEDRKQALKTELEQLEGLNEVSEEPKEVEPPVEQPAPTPDVEEPIAPVAPVPAQQEPVNDLTPPVAVPIVLQ